MQLFQDEINFYVHTKNEECRPQLVSTTGQFSIQRNYHRPKCPKEFITQADINIFFHVTYTPYN